MRNKPSYFILITFVCVYLLLDVIKEWVGVLL